MAGQWVSVNDAAAALGTSTDAIRKRIGRGTLASKREDGSVLVWVDDGGMIESGDISSDLIAAKDETIRVLTEQLKAEREANRENRRIIAGLIERVPSLEAGSEATRPQNVQGDAPEGSSPPEPETGARRGFLRRWLGV